MAISKAQQRATANYVKKNYDRIELKVQKGEKDQIKAHAAKIGESLNGYIYRLIKQDMGETQ